MDQPLPYEQLIGAKLQGLSLPDMENMIWARVKAQLDIDMPTDDGDGGDNGPQSPVAPAPIRWGVTIMIIALVAAFLFFTTKPTTTENNPALPINSQPVAQPSNEPTGPPAGDPILTPPPLLPQLTPTPVGSSIDTTSVQPDLSLPVTTGIDSANSNKPDSIFAQATPPGVKTDTIPPKKKGKGVSGLKEEDYRIVPKNKE